MAITDTRPTSEAAVASTAGARSPSGLAGLLGTGNHLSLGRMYVGASLLFGVVAFALAALFNVSLVNTDVISGEHTFQVFTLSRFALVLLFAMPLFLGLATAVVPLQVGASTIAFPRAAAAAFWTWLLAGLLLISAVAAGGLAATNEKAAQLTLLALAGLAVALILGSICVVTTVVAFRPTGMRLDRVPFFSWSMLVVGIIWTISLSVWVGNIALVFVDAKYGAPSQFGVARNQWPQLAWLVTQPQLFVVLIPALGALTDAVVTFSGARVAQRGAVFFGLGAFGALAFGAYAQPVFVDEVWHSWVVVGASALLLLPVLAVLAGWAAAFKAGKVRAGGPVPLAVVAILLTLLAVIAGILFGIGRLGLLVDPPALSAMQAVREVSTSDPMAGSPVHQWGLLGLVMGAVIAAGLASTTYWSPKLVGRRASAGVAGLGLLLALGVALLGGVPLVVLAFGNKWSGINDAATTFLWISVAGFGLGALAALIGGVGLLSRIGGERDAADAWGNGQTFEWLADSPPAPGNFGELPEVTSAEPLLDLADQGGEG